MASIVNVKSCVTIGPIHKWQMFGPVQQIGNVLQQTKLTLEKPQTTINLPCMNLIIFPAPASCF